MQALLVDGILESLRIGIGFLWTAAWAIIMGLVITGLVQVYREARRVPRGLSPRYFTNGDSARRESIGTRCVGCGPTIPCRVPPTTARPTTSVRQRVDERSTVRRASTRGTARHRPGGWLTTTTESGCHPYSPISSAHHGTGTRSTPVVTCIRKSISVPSGRRSQWSTSLTMPSAST